MKPGKNLNRQHIKKFYRFLDHKGFTEVRVIDPKGGLASQAFVNNYDDFLEACEKYSGKYNVYAGVNERRSKEGKAEHVSSVTIIPVDVDPIRPKGQASTQEELDIARHKAEEIRGWLTTEFDCEPFISMSGNGYHLLIKIPHILVDEFNRDSVEEKLEVFIHELQDRFSDEKARLDSTFDLPRLMKVPGTLSVKGENTHERPWRLSEIVDAKDKPCVILRSYLAQLTPSKAGSQVLGTKAAKEFTEVLEMDGKLKDLFEGDWKKHGFPSRSEAEQSLLTKLVTHNFSEEAIYKIMSRCRIGKWQEKDRSYRRLSIERATEFVKRHTTDEGEKPLVANLTWEDVDEPITFEKWRKVIADNFPHLWRYTEACVSVFNILKIKYALPFALILQGVPGCGKSTILAFFSGCPLTCDSDRFTSASFVSHAPQKSRKQLAQIDLLPKIRHKLFVTPDLNVLFGLEKERLREALSLITRVLDGRGLVTQSGTHGTRGYKGDYMFTWIAATTPIPYRVWNLFGNLGSRMFFYNLEPKKKTEKERINNLRELPYRLKLQKCSEATQRFLKGIWQKPKIEWNRKKDPEKILSGIVRLAMLLVRLRGKINVVVKTDYQGEQTHYTTPIIEEATRAELALYNLARGHAITKNREQLTSEDLSLLIDVALSSAPYDRVNVFKCLFKKEGKVTVTDLVADLKCSRKTAIRTMKTLELLELVDLQKEQLGTAGGLQIGYAMSLKPEFKWFMSKEFRKLWQGTRSYAHF